MEEIQPENRPKSEDLLETIHETREMVAKLRNRMDDKLQPVMTLPEDEQVETPEEERPVNPHGYPPLFLEIDERMDSIRRSVRAMSEFLDRTEL